VVGVGGAVTGTGGLTFLRSSGVAKTGNVWNVESSDLLSGVGGSHGPGLVWPPPHEAEKERKRDREVVNLDTGGIVAATSLANVPQTLHLLLYLSDKKLVATSEALQELQNGNVNFAGGWERVLLGIFLERVERIPGDPSDRVLALEAMSNKQKKKLGMADRIIFGTGDKMDVYTVTNDEKFPKEAEKQNVRLKIHLIKPPISYSGR
jgi:hypothetical protein